MPIDPFEANENWLPPEAVEAIFEPTPETEPELEPVILEHGEEPSSDVPPFDETPDLETEN